MEKNKNLKEIVIKVEGEKWEKALDMAFKKANEKAKIPGFRPGKAPKSVFLKNYGIESLFMDASNYAVEDAYNQMIEENKDLDFMERLNPESIKVLKGYAEEAGIAVRDWGFNNTNYECLYSYMNTTNIASFSTAASLGMKRVKEYYDGEENLFVYMIRKDDWNNIK